MKKHGGWSFAPVMFVCTLAVIAGALMTLLYYRDYPVAALVQAILAVIVTVFSSVYISGIKRAMRLFAKKLVNQQNGHSELFENLSIPVAVFKNMSEIIWYNPLFRTSVLKGRDMYGDDCDMLINESQRNALRVSGKVSIQYGGRDYTCYYGGFTLGDDSGEVVYFIDDTDLKIKAAEYERRRPVAAVVSIDALDDLTDGLPESEQAMYRSTVEREIEKWAQNAGGLIRRFGGNRYIVAMDEGGLETAKEAKFSVLDSVRMLNINGRGNPTLSIGVGHGGKNLKECEALALQALDMAFGRGGDQAVVKDQSSFEFFGGVKSSGEQRHTKVRARVVAAALRELIEGSDNVFITGHKFSDLDCVGAAFGLWRVVTGMEKNCRIVIDSDKTLAGELIKDIRSNAGGEVFCGESAALSALTKKSLLIIVDVHRAEFLDYPGLYRQCPTTVVIDHHRKTVDYIDNAVIFYHEPYASSACEMVTELLQYLGGEPIGAFEANALMSGIMLDTRSFVLRTGTRTFEASAYLRGRGADPVEVKRYFAGSMEVYREKSAIVASAEIYKCCAVAFDGNIGENTRIASAQAADELLNIENVNASFVMFESGSVMNISARSMGRVNVQLIMEELGGGGHHTMAAAQLENVNEEEARARLISAIDKVVG